MTDGTGPPPAGPRRLIGELRVTDGPDAGKMFAVAEDTVLGRQGTADMALADSSGELSRRHARIGLRDGEPMIEDLKSTNGTFLNGERVQGARPLQAGDRIRIGANTLEFAPAAALQFTRAREIPSPADLTRAREIPSSADLTRARRIRRAPSPQPAPPEPVPPPPERPVTFAPPGSDGELQILSGPGTGATAALIGGSATIGREPECDLQVLDSEVSRRHAKVTVRDGTAVIDDLHSANGTYVNGERILASYTLAPRDRVQIGEATIELTSPVFAGVPVRTLGPQVTGVRDVLSQPAKLLGAESGSRKWWTLAVVLITVFMLLLDVTIVAVALPSISKSLKPGFSALQWVVDGYSLMLTSVLLTMGSLADIFGRKRVLRGGLVLFILASVLCAQAPNATVLDFARGLQGIGGATMFACSLALIVQEFPAKERALAFGLYGATNGLSVALGPIVGGLLVQGIGWQAIFYLNVPIGILAFVALQRKVVNLPGPPTTIDWGGLVTFTGAIFLAIFATIRGNESGWTSAVILGCYGAAIILAVAFVAIELRREQPMFDLSLFRNPTFIGSSVSAFTVCFAVLALIFFLTTWFQSVLGYSAIGTGARMLVFTGLALAAGPIGGRLSGGGALSPRFTLSFSLALVAGGILSMTSVNAGSSWTAILPGLCLAGFGLGLINPTLASTAVGVVPPWRGGMASGMNSTCREAGTTAGIAVLGTVLQHQVLVHVHAALAGSPLASVSKTAANAISVGGTPTLVARAPAAFRPGLRSVAHLSYAAGLQHIFLLAGLMAAAGSIIAAVVVRKRHMLYAGEGGH
jgi:EmrB/QacA subfamily drug resistance transporter